MVKRAIFHRKDIQQAFEQYGFVVLPGIPEVELATLSAYCRRLPEESLRPFYTSTDVTDPLFREEGDRLIRKSFSESWLRSWIDRYTPFFSSFIVKQPESKGDSRVDLHADWSIYDETRHDALTMWMPLCDVNAQNGCMHVLPGSHRWVQTIRGVGIAEAYKKPLRDLAFSELFPVPMKAGHVLCYHNALLHASPPNQSNTSRTACLVSFHPEEEEPVLYYRPRIGLPGRIWGYPIDLEFFREYDKRSKPKGRKPLFHLRYTPPALTGAQCLTYRKEHARDDYPVYFS